MEAKSDEEEDDFQTDDDEEMEVDKQEQQKRKKVGENCLKLPVIQMLMSGISDKKNPQVSLMTPLLSYSCLSGPGRWFSEEISK